MVVADFVWHWSKDGRKIFTRRTEVAEKAMREGTVVHVLQGKKHIFRQMKK